MATAKKQTGLGIDRKKLAFTCSWKKGETYTAQEFQYKLNDGSWVSASVGKDATSKKITLSENDYYPSTGKKLTRFAFRVRANAKGDSKSDWVSYALDLLPANKPTLTVTPDDSLDNVTVFSWEVTDTKKHPLVNVQYQTMLTEGNEEPDWNVSSLTKNATGSVTITETAGDIADGSHTRWVRVRGRGCGGTDSTQWVVKKRNYSEPYAAQDVKTTANVQASGIQVSVDWSQFKDFAYPVDETEAQYTIGVPRAGMLPPTGNWNKLAALKGDGGAVSGFIDDVLDADECLWVRVVTTHLVKQVASEAVIAAYGSLADPELTSVQKNDQTFRATVTATNKSTVPGSFLVVQYRTKSAPSDILTVGIIPNGSTSTTVQCPDWSGETAVEFGVYAVVGTYVAATRGDGASSYEVTATMQSAGTVWEGGSVPQAPTNLLVKTTNVEGTVRVTWDWDWEEADGAVISWADHADAWESTDEPQEYTLTNLQAGAWNVAGLDMGKRWYFRVRLLAGTGENAVAGSWSNMAVIDLSIAPGTPVLNLSQRYVTVDGSVAAYWTYISGDGTEQAYAEICEATITGNGITYGNVIATATTEQNRTLYASELGWNSGETHYLCARVVSASGQASDRWSDPVAVVVANPISMSVSQSSLVVDDGEYFLTALPMTVTVTGAGLGGVTSIVIARASAYFIDQPDERPFNGYEDETIVMLSQTGDAQITITRDDLIGQLNDGAEYNLIATVEDEYGQTAEVTIPFKVNWAHKALKPWGTVYFDGTVAVIQCSAYGYASGDVCDVYRLSADRPQLVYSGLTFGEKIVDPYPAIGDFAGYRLVYRTYNNDYITADNEIAWFDIDGGLDLIYSLIDFADGQIRFIYDVSQNTKWEKDFKQTKYLGGTVTGDWNKAIVRSATLNGAVVTTKDLETMMLFRRLADYAGQCHLRTVDGSSFACDIQVTEDRHYDRETVRGEYSLTISQVEPDELDGILYDDWIGGA